VAVHVLACVEAALAVADDVHPLDTETLLQVIHRRRNLGAVAADSAKGVKLDGVEADVTIPQARAPDGWTHLQQAIAIPFIGADAPAVRQQNWTPSQARLILGLQGHPGDFERNAHARVDAAGEHKGDPVGPWFQLRATRLRRALTQAGVGRERHRQHGHVQPVVLPLLIVPPEGALQRAEGQLVIGDAPVEDDLDVEVVHAQVAAGIAGADPEADGEHQHLGQRSLIEMHCDGVEREEAVGIDGADHASGMERDGDDVARRHDRMGDVEPVALVSHKEALGRRPGRRTRVAHGDLRRIRHGDHNAPCHTNGSAATNP